MKDNPDPLLSLGASSEYVNVLDTTDSIPGLPTPQGRPPEAIRMVRRDHEFLADLGGDLRSQQPG